MELKFLVFTFLVLFVSFGCIETRRSSGGSRSSSRGSSSRGSSHSSSSYGHSSGSSYGHSSGSSYGHSSGSSYGHSSSLGSSGYGSGRTSSSGYGGRPTSNTHSGSTGSFLNSERGHSSSSGNNSPFRPFATVPPPKNSGNNSPYRPFATVPPPKNNAHTNSPFKPFATVPPPKNNGHTNSPFKPFGSVPPPTNTGYPKPAPPPPGIILPHSNSHPSAPPAGPHIIKPTTYPNTQGSNPALGPTTYPRQPAYNPAFPGPGNHSVGHGSFPPPGGWNIPPSNNRPTGTFPPTPIQPTHYPTQQGSYPGGSVFGQNHPAVNQPPPFYSPYPGYHPTSGHINPVQTHVVHHTLPPNPAQTVVVVPGPSGSYHRSTGDIFKEAIIHAGVNAAVNKIVFPSHYHDHYNSHSWNNNYGVPPQGTNTVSTTNTHITNVNYYPGSTGNNGGESNPVPPNGNPQFYPGGGVQGGSGNYPNSGSPVNYPNSGSPVNYPNSGSPGSPGSGGSQILTNGQSRPHQNNDNGQVNNGYILDQELMYITEKLFGLDENNASKFITLNLQKQIQANNTNVTDESPQPLFTVQPAAYNIPTIRAIRTLYRAAAEIENKTREDSRREEALFVDLILNTNVMTAAMDYLTQKNLIKNDYYAHRDMLKHLWFTPYDGSSSAFKRVFQGEIYEGILWGIQDWIAFDFHEKSGRANYFSYVNKTDLGKSSPNTAILKTNFHMNGNMKTGTALFVGISPELQMALYTICYHTRRDYYCDVSLGGTPVRIYTHAGRYFGDDLIDVAFPIV